MELVKAEYPQTAFDAEQALIKVMNDLPTHSPDIVNDLKDGAFQVGADISALLFVGALYIRDTIFTSLGFRTDDIDKKTS